MAPAKKKPTAVNVKTLQREMNLFKDNFPTEATGEVLEPSTSTFSRGNRDYEGGGFGSNFDESLLEDEWRNKSSSGSKRMNGDHDDNRGSFRSYNNDESKDGGSFRRSFFSGREDGSEDFSNVRAPGGGGFGRGGRDRNDDSGSVVGSDVYTHGGGGGYDDISEDAFKNVRSAARQSPGHIPERSSYNEGGGGFFSRRRREGDSSAREDYLGEGGYDEDVSFANIRQEKHERGERHTYSSGSNIAFNSFRDHQRGDYHSHYGEGFSDSPSTWRQSRAPPPSGRPSLNLRKSRLAAANAGKASEGGAASPPKEDTPLAGTEASEGNLPPCRAVGGQESSTPQSKVVEEGLRSEESPPVVDEKGGESHESATAKQTSISPSTVEALVKQTPPSLDQEGGSLVVKSGGIASKEEEALVSSTTASPSPVADDEPSSSMSPRVSSEEAKLEAEGGGEKVEDDVVGGIEKSSGDSVVEDMVGVVGGSSGGKDETVSTPLDKQEGEGSAVFAAESAETKAGALVPEGMVSEEANVGGEDKKSEDAAKDKLDAGVCVSTPSKAAGSSAAATGAPTEKRKAFVPKALRESQLAPSEVSKPEQTIRLAPTRLRAPGTTSFLRKKAAENTTVEGYLEKLSPTTEAPDESAAKAQLSLELELKKKKNEEKRLLKLEEERIRREEENLLFSHDPATIKSFSEKIHKAVVINGDDYNEEVQKKIIEEFGSLRGVVPLIVLSSHLMLRCCKSCIDFRDVEKEVKKIISLITTFLKGNDSKISEVRFLQEIVKISARMSFPRLSPSVALLEALYDALYFSEVVQEGSFLEWYQDDNDSSSERRDALFQLIGWFKWLESSPGDDGDLVEELESLDASPGMPNNRVVIRSS